jgi:hypothetical protein
MSYQQLTSEGPPKSEEIIEDVILNRTEQSKFERAINKRDGNLSEMTEPAFGMMSKMSVIKSSKL